MSDDVLFNSINEILEEEKILKNTYNLDTKPYKEKIDINYNLDDIFYDCYLMAYGYSYYYFKERTDLYFRMNNCFNSTFLWDTFTYTDKQKKISIIKSQILDTDELLFYDSLKNHCIIKALSTIEYLLLKDSYVDTNHLAIVTINEIYNPEFITDMVYTASDNIEKINARCDSLYRSNYDFYKKLCSIECNTTGGKIKRKIPEYLSNFTYSIINCMRKDGFRLDEAMKSILQNEDNEIVLRKKLNILINGLSKLNEDINIAYSEKNMSKKALFYYKKESSFSFELLKHLFMDGILYGDIEGEMSKEDYEEIYKVREGAVNSLISSCLKLPNVFSRNYYIYRIYAQRKSSDEYEFDYIHSINQTKSDINYLCKITFPVFEKYYFILLYNIFYSKSRKNVDILNDMRDCLCNYINGNSKNVLCKYSFNLHTEKGQKNNLNLTNYLNSNLSNIKNSKDRYIYISKFIKSNLYDYEDECQNLYTFKTDSNEYRGLISKYFEYSVKDLYDVEKLSYRYQKKLSDVEDKKASDICYPNQYDRALKILSK